MPILIMDIQTPGDIAGGSYLGSDQSELKTELGTELKHIISQQ